MVLAASAGKPEQASIRSLLKRLGLSEREIEIYIALLSLKSAKASTIAKIARQPRTLTYPMLERLEQKGIVARVVKGSTLYFVAESPRRLLSYASERTKELQQLEGLLEQAMPQLESLTNPHTGEPRITLLHGMDGMKQVYRDALQHEILGIFNPAVMYEAFGGNLHTMILGDDVKLRGKDLFVDGPAVERFLKEMKPHDDYQVRVLSKEHKFLTDTLIYGDTVVLFSYDDEKTIVRIENQKLADTFRAWFQLMWQMGKVVSR
jgi:predicted transcriptional regulator